MALSTAYKYPLNIDSTDSEYKHRITFTALRNRQGTEIPASSGSVTLYMPGEALKTTYGQSYGDAELGALGNLVSGMDRGGCTRGTSSNEGWKYVWC